MDESLTFACFRLNFCAWRWGSGQEACSPRRHVQGCRADHAWLAQSSYQLACPGSLADCHLKRWTTIRTCRGTRWDAEHDEITSLASLLAACCFALYLQLTHGESIQCRRTLDPGDGQVIMIPPLVGWEPWPPTSIATLGTMRGCHGAP